jgi:hypothetical protein
MLYWCVGILLQIFNSDDGFSLYDVITIEQATLSYQVYPKTVVISSEKGLLHIVIGLTATKQVYGLTYKASTKENTDGMRFSACFLCMLIYLALLGLIWDGCR